MTPTNYEGMDMRTMEFTLPEAMQALAISLDRILNGEKKTEPKHGFALLLFPFDDPTKCNYISNGASRADIVRLFKYQIKVMEDMEAKEAKEAKP